MPLALAIMRLQVERLKIDLEIKRYQAEQELWRLELERDIQAASLPTSAAKKPNTPP